MFIIKFRFIESDKKGYRESYLEIDSSVYALDRIKVYQDQISKLSTTGEGEFK